MGRAYSIDLRERVRPLEEPSIQLLAHLRLSQQLLAHLRLTDLLGLDLGTVIIDVPRGWCPVPINPTHNSFSVSSDFSRYLKGPDDKRSEPTNISASPRL